MRATEVRWHAFCIILAHTTDGRARRATGRHPLSRNQFPGVFMTAADVLKLIKEKEVKFVDLRFTDTKGKEQHVTVPTRMVDETFFEDGKGFDGSSIAGWKGIQESDMILMPDPATAVVDPFYEETTLDLRCDVIEPSNMQGYERDPRSLAKRCEAYLKSTGIADSALFGPENEFFIFDSMRHGNSMQGAFYEVDSVQGAWNSGRSVDGGNLGHRPGVKGGYFPVPPVDAYQDLRTAMCQAMEELGLKVEVHHHEVATAGQGEINVACEHADQEGRRGADPEICDPQRGGELWQDGDFHAETTGRRQRQRDARQPVSDEGRQEHLRRRQVRRALRARALLHRRDHQARQGAERDLQREHQQLQAAGAGV
jgi:hypothetical protein